MRRNTLEDFWALVRVNLVTGCWEWQNTPDAYGYGRFSMGGKNHRAHVLSYEIESGPVGDRWKFVCHHCDNRICVNPNHLYLGTPKSNMEDCVARGRHSGGSCTGFNNKRCKIGNSDLVVIAELAAAGKSRAAIGKLFNVNSNHIGRILNGKRRTLE